MREDQIIYETSCQKFWVFCERNMVHVMKNTITHSFSESAFQNNEGGIELAKIRADYLSKRKA